MNPYVCVVGAVNLDICGRPEKKLIFRDSNPGAVTLTPGGVGRNIAHDLRLLGVEVKFLTAFGGDSHAQLLRNDCVELGMDLSCALDVPGGRTSTYLYITDERGEMQLGLCDTDISAAITPDYLQRHLDVLDGAAAVVLDGNLTAETITWLGAHCSAPLFADPVSVTKAERMRASLGALHTFKPNLTEGQNLTGESTPEGIVAALLALLAGLCCKLPKVLSVVSRLALTAALAVGLCLNGGYLRGVVRTHHAENLAAYQFFVRTIEAGLADAVQSDDLILCNENVWDSNADAETAFFSRFTGRALHAQVLWTENPATDGDAYAYQTYRNYGGYDLAWCGRLQSADSDLMDGVQVYVQSAYVPDNAVIKYKVRLADGTEEARAICLLDCTQTPRDRNGDYLATVEDTSIVNAKLMIWDG